MEEAECRNSRLGGRSFGDHRTLVMAIINRTPDSFYNRGATWDDGPALDRLDQVVSEGADIVDIGGVKAAPGSRSTPLRRFDGWRGSSLRPARAIRT